MQSKQKVLLSIVLTIILLAAAILIWANQTGKITIWGDTGEEIIKTFSLSDSKSVLDTTPGVLSGCYDQYGWERRCLTVSLPLAITSDIRDRATKAVLRDYSFDNVGEMRIKAGNSSFVSIGGQYKENTQSLSCGGGFKWNYTAGADIYSLMTWAGDTNVLSFTAMDCGYAFNGGGGGTAERVGGAVYLDIYGVKQTQKPTVNFTKSDLTTPDNNSITIGAGQSATLYWKSTNATTLTINPGNIDVSNSISRSVSPSSTTAYTITATNNAGTATDQKTVSVQSNPVPVIEDFHADSSSVESGQATTLRWKTSYASSVSINNGINNVAASGSTTTGALTKPTTFTITASNGSVSTTASTMITINSTQPPSPPTNLIGTATACSAGTGSTINLTWTASPESNVTGYKIYNAEDNTSINSTLGTTWPITGVACGTTKKYYVKAYNTSSHSLASNTTIVSTPNGGGGDDKIAPTTPTNLTAEGTSCSEIKLSWTASTDAVGVIGYDIYNQTDSANPITTTADTNYTFKSLSEKSTHGYFIKAHDAAKNYSGASNPVSITTPSCINRQPGTGGTGGTNPLAGLKTLISTGQVLWFNIIIAFIVAGIISYFMFRKKIM